MSVSRNKLPYEALVISGIGAKIQGWKWTSTIIGTCARLLYGEESDRLLIDQEWWVELMKAQRTVSPRAICLNQRS